jgi:glycerol uptake facilitator-like aquaporin
MAGRLNIELAGTFVLVLSGILVACSGAPGPVVAASFGVVLVHLAYAFGPRSGGHFNPAVTLAFLLLGKQKLVEAVAYMIVQTIGATGATLFVKLALPSASAQQGKYGLTTLADGFSWYQLILLEGVATLILIVTILFVTATQDVPSSVAGVAIGSALGGGIVAIGPYTGGGLNPARVIGPMLITGNYDSLWAYLVAHVGASVLAGSFFFLLKDTQPPSA